MESIQHSIQYFWQQFHSGHFTGLGNWNYLILAIMALFEGPVSTLLASAAASTGLMNPGGVFVSAVAGNLAGNSFFYLLGRVGKVEWISRLSSRLGIHPSRIDQLSCEMQSKAPRIIFFTKLFNGFVTAPLIAAGLTRVPWRDWFPSALGAEVIWTGSLVLIGYFFAGALGGIGNSLVWIGLLPSMVCLGAAASSWWKTNRIDKTSKALPVHE